MTKKEHHIEKEEFLSEETLAKYQKGELLPSEMRRVEGLLEKYPLYADALEGYGLLETEKIRSAVDFLKTDIQANIQKAKPTKTVFLRSPSIVRVAASTAFLLVSSLGIYFFTMENETKNSEIAQQTMPTTNEEMVLSEPSAKDEAVVESPKETPESGKSVVSVPKETANSQVAILKDKENKIIDQEENLTALDTTSLALSEAAKPIQAAEVDDVVTAAKSAPIAEERKMESEVLEDKVLEDKSVKKERAKSKKMVEKLSISASVPSKDDSLTTLLRAQILLFAKEKNEVARGKLVLTFSTSKEGTVENIHIKESPCQPCNDKIIQWLKEYKKLNKNDLEKKIEIIF